MERNQPSKIFAPAYKKMVNYLKSQGISANAIARSATPADQKTRADDISQFINHKAVWEVDKLERYLSCEIISQDPKAWEIFFGEVIRLLKDCGTSPEDNDKESIENNTPDLGENIYENSDLMINQETAMSNPPLSNIETGEGIRQASYRIGQQDFSDNVCLNYSNCCCFPDCSIHERTFLRGAHIARWADVEEGRGDLSNGLCLCLMHDKAFEAGFFTLTEDLRVAVNKNNQTAMTSKWCEKNLIPYDGDFISLGSLKPSVEALRHHWVRIDFTPDS